jgi:hypothetical protein
MGHLRRGGVLLTILVTAACTTPGASAPRPPAAPDESAFGPLEVGADHATYRRVSSAPFLSAVHGGRWVEVFVNDVGADEYLRGGAIPVGTIVVKTSWESRDGQMSEVAGPLFVMEKRAPGYDPDHGDWWYAIHWAEPTPKQREALGGPIYWRGRSPRAAYCVGCHSTYDRSLGGLTPSSILMR